MGVRPSLTCRSTEGATTLPNGRNQIRIQLGNAIAAVGFVDDRPVDLEPGLETRVPVEVGPQTLVLSIFGSPGERIHLLVDTPSRILLEESPVLPAGGQLSLRYTFETDEDDWPGPRFS